MFLVFIPLLLRLADLGGLADRKPIRIPDGPTVVVVSRIPDPDAAPGRAVTVIGKDEIRSAPARTLSEFLKYGLGLDYQERGALGIQADVSLRASTFQQVLVLVDGVRVNDLQTAHHNLDLPIPLESVERIEILSGNGSSLYGPDAFGGVLNIVTAEPERTRINGRLGVYDHQTRSGALGLSFGGPRLRNTLALEANDSRGFIEGRDFGLLNVSDRLAVRTPNAEFSLLAAYGRKDFGALDFYTPGMNFPSREATRTLFLSAGCKRIFGGSTLTQRVSFRSHRDRFVLDGDRPWLYTNDTTNIVIGTDAVLRFKDWAVGAEAARESVRSLQLGNHRHIRAALFAEYKRVLAGRILLNVGLRQDYHPVYGWATSPSLSVGCWLAPRLKLRAAGGHSFRAPSYTELYYRDPANQGNPDLRPETAWAYECGVDWSPSRPLEATLSLFQRDEKDLIDWIRRPDRKWHADNLKKIRVRGMEAGLSGDWDAVRVRLKTCLFMADPEESSSQFKYGFRFPRVQAGCTLALRPAPAYEAGFHLSYTKRIGAVGTILLDAKIARTLGGFGLFLEGTNLLNASYEDVPGLAMPGRWLGGGIRFEFEP